MGLVFLCCLSFIKYVSTAYISFPVLQIDLQKMPLGKLSKRQIQSAYALLTEVQQVTKSSP